MSNLDVEALLDATANSASDSRANVAIKTEEPRNGKRDRTPGPSRDRSRDRNRDYDRRRRRSSAERTPRSDGSRRGGRHTRSRSGSREHDDGRYRSRRPRDGDFYRRGRGRSRSHSQTRSRSPPRYRPRDGRDRRDRDDRGDRGRGRGDNQRNAPPESSGQPTEDERDRRTVFVQQLAARLRTRELREFFEKVGAVNDAQIVKDRVSSRSKGVGYVEFKQEDSVQAALQLTGQKLLGIPIIVQHTEAEKNHQARETGGTSSGHPNSVPFHRLYVGNIHFNITEQDLRAVFEPFGELEFVQLQKDDAGRSRGYGFVQFVKAEQAKEALEKMNGFELAGRPIRVGLGNDKFTPESTANLLNRFPNQAAEARSYQGSAFSGSGGRGQSSVFDKAGGRDSDKTGGASALDDTDVAGVNFNNFSRDALMRKLARTDEPKDERQKSTPRAEVRPLPVAVNKASRCVVLHNMFNADDEEGEDWIKELEDDVRQEAQDKYGRVIHIAVDPTSNGDIYIKFDKVQGGENAIKGLNGRYFGGRQIDAAPVVDAVYSSLFSRTRAI